MRQKFEGKKLGSKLIFTQNQPNFERCYDQATDGLHTVAWNRGADQKVIVDGVEYPFPKNNFITLMANQTFCFDNSEVVTMWQFNREFYCILDHDKEVSCVGFLWYGWTGMMLLELDEKMIRKFDLLTQIFEDEFETHDTIQGEMLRMLLKRLIILLTRIGKKQYLKTDSKPEEYDLIREYNLLVENNFRKMHQVQDYANLLNKSPKTLSNLFSKLSDKSPLQIIRERIALEAKRLLQYSDQSVSEIAYDLGFEENAHFSRFFKQLAGASPKKFKEAQVEISE